MYCSMPSYMLCTIHYADTGSRYLSSECFRLGILQKQQTHTINDYAYILLVVLLFSFVTVH